MKKRNEVIVVRTREVLQILTWQNPEAAKPPHKNYHLHKTTVIFCCDFIMPQVSPNVSNGLERYTNKSENQDSN